MSSKPNPYPPGSDEFFVRQCLELANGGLGWVSPNPAVGCVIVRDGKIIGSGFHRRLGELHAERAALKEARDARGATCYVSLEPCSHIGRQPACTSALIEAGVSRVVYGTHDADPRSKCQARELLEEAGIEVVSAVLRDECERYLEHYRRRHRLGRPYIHVKMALSLDAKMACANGASQWLSGKESLGYAHYLRQRHDAIMVSYRTVLNDNPRLTARREEMSHYFSLPQGTAERNPMRVVIDPRFELLDKQELNIFDFDGKWREGKPRLILMGAAEHLPAPYDLPDGGICGSADPLGGEGALSVAESSMLSFASIARILSEQGICSVLVEGGPGLIAELLRQRMVDKISAVITPHILGSEGLGFAPALAAEKIADTLKLDGITSQQLGGDVLIEGCPQFTNTD